jgi:hypothetical protein
MANRSAGRASAMTGSASKAAAKAMLTTRCEIVFMARP